MLIGYLYFLLSQGTCES